MSRDTWRCPTCGRDNEVQFESCWNCGEMDRTMDHLLPPEKDLLPPEKMNKVVDTEVEKIVKRHKKEHPELWNNLDPLQNIKESNPKDSIGVKKASMSYVPAPVLMEAALGMMEGGFKYRRHNYRVIGVRASVYYDATMRHLMAYWEGENIDPKSGISHLSKAIASLIVWRDAEMNGKYADDRPPKFVDQEWLEKMNQHVEKLMEMFPKRKPPYTELDRSEK